MREQINKVYLAARYSRHPEMRSIRESLGADFGIQVTSHWLDTDAQQAVEGAKNEDGSAASFTPEFLQQYPERCYHLAAQDLRDIDAADTIIFFSGSGRKGGMHVEFGYAYARDKRMIVVGDRENVFHTLPSITVYPTWSALARDLRRRQ